MGKSKALASPEGLVATIVEADYFAKRLGHVLASLPRRNTIPILNCVLLAARDGEIRLTATNLDQQSEVHFSADVKRDGAVCVDGARLQAVTARMTGELLITWDGEKLKLSAGSARAELPVLPASDFTSLRAPEDGETFEIASGALAAGFGSVLHCASTEETRYYLNGVFVEARGGAMIFTATDGRRLASLEVTAGLDDGIRFEPFIVPRGVLRDWLKFFERANGPVSMTLSDNRLQIGAQGETHLTKLVDGTYPDYERVYPKGAGVRLSMPVRELKTAVGIAMTGTQEKSCSVRFEAEDGRLSCLCRWDSQFSEATVEATDIAPCEPFGLNGKYVLEARDACRGETVELVMIDPSTAVRFETGDKLRQCIMPLRV